MIDTKRQLPHPAASAWLLDLTPADGPALVVLRLDPQDAADTAVGFLIDLGVVRDTARARSLIADLDPQLVAVTW
jgi:hypothetical protein